MLTNLTISEFTAALASKEPAPGGGSAAALSGLLGASLVEMAINLTRGRHEFAGYEALLAGKHAEAGRLRVDLLLLIDRDAAAFNAVMNAYALPRSSEAEKEARAAAIAEAIKEAAEVPLLTARACLAVLEIARAILGKVNPHTMSDLGVGALACHSGLIGALLNTAINMPYLKDESLSKAYGGQVKELRRAADELIAAIRQELLGDPTFAALRS